MTLSRSSFVWGAVSLWLETVIRGSFQGETMLKASGFRALGIEGFRV